MEVDIRSDFDVVTHDIPERGLIAGIINHAFADACERTQNAQFGGRALDGVDFLMSKRSDPYFELLEIDPKWAREGLLEKTRFLPCYSKFRFWLRVWGHKIELNDSGAIKAGLASRKSSTLNMDGLA